MREVKEWLNWIEANEWRQWAMGVYGKAWEGRFSPFKALLTATAKRFGESAQVFLVRAPGRLNLMGRHIDHRGGFVHPIALPREILLTVRPRDDDIVIAHHAEPEKFLRTLFASARLLLLNR